jgi:ABC-type multidrug transport system fused ATPase/permease subunit
MPESRSVCFPDFAQVLRVLKLVKLDSAVRVIQGAREQVVAVDARDVGSVTVGAGADDFAAVNSTLLILLASATPVSSDGLDARLAENGGNLLVGQRQLLCLARALLHSPRIVCVEEAAVSDSANVETVIHRVRLASACAMSFPRLFVLS